jgi:hypothetical protein
LTEEVRARERFIHDLAVREELIDAWSLQSRATIQFEDGFARVEEIDPAVPLPSWHEVPHACVSMPGKFVRYMGPRGHIRVRADGPYAMHLVIRGRVDLGQLFTRPLVTASFDGLELHAALVDPAGYFTIEATIPRERIAEWSDVYVMLSSVHEPWRDPAGAAGAKLTVARLEHVTWEPAP